MKNFGINNTIIHGLVGIAFKTDEEEFGRITKFTNVQIHRDWIDAVVLSFGDKYQDPQRWSVWNRKEHSKERTNSASSTRIQIPLFIIWTYFIVRYF